MAGPSIFRANEQAVQALDRLPGAEVKPAAPFWDAVAANARVTVDSTDHWQRVRKDEAYKALSDAMDEVDGTHRSLIDRTRTDNPYINPIDQDATWTRLEQLRRSGKALPSSLARIPEKRAEFDLSAIERQGATLRDMDTASRGGYVAGLLGGAAGSFLDPPQVLAAFATGGLTSGLPWAKAALIDGAVNAGVAGLTMPGSIAARKRLGIETSNTDIATEIGGAFVFGAGMSSLGHAAGAAMDHFNPWDRQAAHALAGAELDKASDADVVKLFRATVPDHAWTPDQAAAVHTIERVGEVDATNPFAHTYDAMAGHIARVDAATEALVTGRPVAMPRARVGHGGVDAFLGAVRRQESGGNPNARSTTSSASGLYGFTNGTWVSTYRAEFPNSGLTDAAILARKGDTGLQDRLARRLTENNASWLRGIGAADDPGNLYVVHHLGQGDAGKVLRAAADTPLADLLSPRVIEANPHMRGKTAGEFVAWARERMGQDAGPIERVPGGAADETGMAMAEERASIEADRARADDATGASLAERYSPEQPALPDVPELRRDLFPDEASWRLAQNTVRAEAGLGPMPERVTAFTTAKGSTYAVNESGLTLRDKAARPEHPGESGPQPISQATFYMRPEDMQPLALMQARGGEAMQIVTEGDHAAIRYTTGPDAGKIVQGTVVPIQRNPEIGLHPVELWQDGARVHFGNAIVDMQRAAPAAAPAPAAGEPRGAATVANGDIPATSSGARELATDLGPVRAQELAGGPAMEGFADPASADLQLQADRIWHDLRAMAETDTRPFQIGENDSRTIAALLDEFDGDAKAINAVRACL